ncbi:MAG: choline kinase [Nonlabens sp.]|jgi:choline kinase
MMSKISSKNQVRVGFLGAGAPYKGVDPSGLTSVGDGMIILDWMIAAYKDVADAIEYVGGYQINSVKEKYPELIFLENFAWDTTKSAASFFTLDFKKDCDYFVSYTDIVHREDIPEKMSRSSGDVVIAIDSRWTSRYEDRRGDDIANAEKCCIANGRVTFIGKQLMPNAASAEFVGVARFKSSVIDFLRNLDIGVIDQFNSASMSDVIEFLRLHDFSISYVDLLGDWAELNDARDVSNFILGTKAETLGRLRQVVKHSNILDQKAFRAVEWADNPGKLMEELSSQFESELVIIRSSALAEDNLETANAGAFQSLLNIDSGNALELASAIDSVIASYPDSDPHNQVLIQPMLKNVHGSGVIFTRVLQNGAPYYVINYDDQSKSTESVTSGTSANFKTYKIRRDQTHLKSLPQDLKKLLVSVKEIEKLFSHDRLDIEFAINMEGEVNILQVRPIVVHHKSKVSDDEIYSVLDDGKAFFDSLQVAPPQIVGERTIFGSMPDWNPAEIIGVRPNRLAADIYNFLILSDVWARQRAEYGYRDVRPAGLMKFFGGQPYIDVRASFNSFIPAGLEDNLAEKFVNFYLNWLELHPELHDKVEFDVLPTCYSLSFSGWRERFEQSGSFESEEVSQLEVALKGITRDAVKGAHCAQQDLVNLTLQYQSVKFSSMEPLSKALRLLQDAKTFGTLAFSHLARDGFVAVTLLKSGVESGFLSSQAFDEFMGGIKTVTHGLTDDARKVHVGDMAWDDLVSKYGHLRPGTYNILSERYSSDPEFFLRPLVDNTKSAEIIPASENWKKQKVDFFNALISLDLAESHAQLERFLVSSIEGREYGKFLFSRNVSDALELIAEYGESIGINKNSLSHISLGLFLDTASRYSESDCIKRAIADIDRSKKDHEVTGMIELPPLICNKDHFDGFMLPKNEGNFIGERHLISECVFLDASRQEQMLDGKIVFIVNADPGYDWLFGRNISGLVTMFGGANSHMSIRTAEFGMPAVIGIGEKNFEELKSASVVEFDGLNKFIRKVR